LQKLAKSCRRYLWRSTRCFDTSYHWIRASQSTLYTPLIASGSSFGREGTQPVRSEGALSGFGTANITGNVKERCLNEALHAKRLILGGSFGEPTCMFSQVSPANPEA